MRLLVEMFGIVMTAIAGRNAIAEAVFHVQIAFHLCERMRNRNILWE